MSWSWRMMITRAWILSRPRRISLLESRLIKNVIKPLKILKTILTLGPLPSFSIPSLSLISVVQLHQTHQCWTKGDLKKLYWLPLVTSCLLSAKHSHRTTKVSLVSVLWLILSSSVSIFLFLRRTQILSKVRSLSLYSLRAVGILGGDSPNMTDRGRQYTLDLARFVMVLSSLLWCTDLSDDVESRRK